MLNRVPLLAALLLPCVSLADLHWKNPFQETTYPNPGNEKRLLFDFQNSGPSPVHIDSAASSCSCVRIEFPKRTIQPGERAQLTAILRSTGTPSPRTVTVEVATAENPARSQRLEIHLKKEAPLSLEPAVLVWSLRAPEKSQTTLIGLGNFRAVSLPELAEDFPFELTWLPNSADATRRLSVQPKSTQTPLETQVPLEFGEPGKSPSERRTLFLKILP